MLTRDYPLPYIYLEKWTVRTWLAKRNPHRFLESESFDKIILMQKSYFWSETYERLVLELAEQTQLFLLKDRLKKIRQDRRKAVILSLAISFMAAIILRNYFTDFVIGFFTWFTIGLVFALIVIRYYDAQEKQVLWQIEQLARGSSAYK